jgi:hypothetical protein
MLNDGNEHGDEQKYVMQDENEREFEKLSPGVPVMMHETGYSCPHGQSPTVQQTLSSASSVHR